MAMDRRAVLLGGTAVAAFGAFMLLRPMAIPVARRRRRFRSDLTDEEWKAKLSPQAYDVLRHEGTEYPFTSPLNDEHRAGIFNCAGCDQALFDSATKFDSGTGWPSFYTFIEGAMGTTRRQFAGHDAHRGSLQPLRRPSGPRVQ